MDSSDDDDSSKSIPRPIYEATSAIDSPPPHQQSAGNEMEPLPNKRMKYVVSSPPNSANGSTSSSSNTWPVTAVTAGGTGGHASLTMKLTKVTTTQPQSELKSANTSTPKQDTKVRVPKEMIALQRSHNESKVLTGYVSDGSKLKRRKSRAVAAQLIKQAVTGGLSTTLPTGNKLRVTLKRSKSIPAPVWDSDDMHFHQEPDPLLQSAGKTPRKRNYSVAYDDAPNLGDELSGGDESSSNAPSYSTIIRERFRVRSKTISLSSDERPPRRGNMRSENEEFARKHSAFLDRVINDTVDPEQPQHTGTENVEWRTSSVGDTDGNISMYSESNESKHVSSVVNASDEIEGRLYALWEPPPRPGWDPFCWKCRGCAKLMPCSKCLRSFHGYCVRPASTKFDDTWKCPECVLIESAPKRSRRNDVSMEMLSQLLSYALERMKHVRWVYKLRAPQEVLPDCYGKYFVNPVSFESLSGRIKNRAFHTVDEFLSEVKWMQHNALILDKGDIKVEQASKAVVKICRQEANEIDTCAECYLNANSSEEWFVKVCTHPHLLLWAKLKGFPYWPAKAMGAGPNAVVNVRFFGKHDRANVPVKDCFLYSAQDPNTQTSRRSARDLAECIREVEIHIDNIRAKIGTFNYAPYRMPYDPLEEQHQLEEMMPGLNDIVDRQLEPANKTPLQFLIRKTAGDKLSIVKKTKTIESGNESDQSCSPNKKSTQDTELSLPPPAPSNDAPKPKSSNYEVIPRAGDALKESRGCTVVLKRKSLESCKAIVKLPSSSKSAAEAVSITKRKHSHSDASSETSQQGTCTEHRRRTKHARKHAHATAAVAKRIEQEMPNETEEQHMEREQSVPAEKNASVVSVVELVRRRQGVTITKIPRDQQQQQAAAAKPNDPEQREIAAEATIAKQQALERQQKQIISKVVPFVEIKTEVMSEPEETEDAPSVIPGSSTATALPATLITPNAVVPDIKIKEEVLSEEEMERETDAASNKPDPPPIPPPPPLPSRVETQTTLITPTPSATASAQQANDGFVRFVGDTTIQRLSQKQTQTPKLPETSSKRCSLRGVPHGPLPADALSPTPTTSSTPPPPPAPILSPRPATSCISMRVTTQVSPKAQPEKSVVQSVQQQQQLRVKTDKSLSSSPPPTPTASLLKSNMVVIPLDPRNTNGGGNNSSTSTSNSNNNSCNSSNLNSSSIMAIPVPPLRAVSKNTLQTAPTHTTISAVPLPPPAFSNTALPPPPLAGLTTGITASVRPTSSTEPGGLLASVLNGLPSDTLVSESTVAEHITHGVGAALSELILRSGPPKLSSRPTGPLHSDGCNVFPAHAGPLSTRLKENAHKITDYFISVIEDTLSDLAHSDPSVLHARIAGLTLENERIKLHYERQFADIQRSSDKLIAEMRKTMEQENKRVISELRQHSTLERMRAVEDAKKKQWCANCMREAQLYCCWNTSYCDYPCQQMHWQRHSANCGQASTLHPNQSQTATSQSQSHQPPQAQVQMMHAESSRSKPKTAANAPNPGQPMHRTPAVTVAVGANKRWGHQSMISLVNPPPPSAEVLKLPNNTFLRPVSLPSTVTTSAGNSSNSNIAPITLMAPSPSTHLGSNTMANQRSTMGYAGKQTQPVSGPPRYNIPLPITVNTNPNSFGNIAEQHQKYVAKSTGRSSLKNTSRTRTTNSQSSGNSSHNNSSNNAQSMRHNQLSHAFQH